jgi:cytochrome b6-f complex iron-sulfur subunit
MEDAKTFSSARREFVAKAVLWASGLIGLSSFAYRFLQYLYPVVPPEQVIEVPAGRRDVIPPGGGTVVSLPTGQIALLDAGGEIRAFSAVCTHLGCIVKWDGDVDRLFCPCHKGTFGREGQVTGGPPPRPLQRFPVEIRGGQVFVKIKFRPKPEEV